MKPNWITPKPLFYVDTEDFYIEVSAGVFLGDETIGVTVHSRETGLNTDHSKSFETLKEAKQLIKNLTNKKK